MANSDQTIEEAWAAFVVSLGHYRGRIYTRSRKPAPVDETPEAKARALALAVLEEAVGVLPLDATADLDFNLQPLRARIEALGRV